MGILYNLYAPGSDVTIASTSPQLDILEYILRKDATNLQVYWHKGVQNSVQNLNIVTRSMAPRKIFLRSFSLRTRFTKLNTVDYQVENGPRSVNKEELVRCISHTEAVCLPESVRSRHSQKPREDRHWRSDILRGGCGIWPGDPILNPCIEKR